ncbi:DUF5692 family protein [Lachnospira eligens]|uniref:DUF5692 family protein n=1 Tax=Lachnospira eligens TaxID=39485 RepID=UPI00189E13DF|nr:DUF5692 family protein [Lachnospira eligens]
MLFQLYGSTAMTQLLGWVLVFAGLVILNEIGRRTKIGGIVLFVIIPAILTIYFIAIQAGLFGGHSNQTYEYMNGWFHYAKLYAADIGVVGFLMIKYKWGIGKKEWFKPWPFIIVAINILIAVASDFESAIRAYQITGDFSGAWWASNEGVFLYGGWWNIVNGIAGLINIFCMTGWWGIYSSKKKDDMLWPDMTIWFIVAYDIWNFEYTYCNLPTHTWYCGVALLLAPTFANALWNKGGWIQNRAMTLATWCMFAQVLPLFQLSNTFSVLPSLYGGATKAGVRALDLYNAAITCHTTGASAGDAIANFGITANPTAQGVVAMLAIIANVVCISVIIKRSIEQKKCPYTKEIWVGTRDYEQAMSRAE